MCGNVGKGHEMKKMSDRFFLLFIIFSWIQIFLKMNICSENTGNRIYDGNSCSEIFEGKSWKRKLYFIPNLQTSKEFLKKNICSENNGNGILMVIDVEQKGKCKF